MNLRTISKYFLFVFVFFLCVSFAACRREGCPYKGVQTETTKNGQYKVGKTKSGLFPKKMK
jgi:hypothetical protein